MVSAGSYLLGAVQLLAVALPLAWASYRLRAALLPAWSGAPARLVESVAWVSVLIGAAELLGLFGLLYPGTLIAATLCIAAAATLLAGGAVGGPTAEEASAAGGGGGTAATGPADSVAVTAPMTLAMVIAIGLVVAQWAVTTKHALDAGIFNFDSLWYHMPFAVDIARGHSVTGLHYVDTVFTNWLYPQNSELLHGLGILLTGRDTLSLFLNFGWLAMAFLAAWCVGRPYGRGELSVVASAVLLGCHTLVVREPGAAKNDLMAAALLLAAVAVLVELHSSRARRVGEGPGDGSWRWALGAAGLAAGLAVGTKSTALAMAAALTVAAVALAPAGRRWAALGWWTAAGFATAGYWYARNLVVAGNPIPQIESLGPIPLPHPERLQTGRPDFSVAHYATDPGIWRHYFAPGLETAFGVLWPLVIGACVLGAVLAVARGERVLRWAGAVALVGMVAYLFTPLSAAGAEGAPSGFGINIRYAVPALLVGLALLPAAPAFARRGAQWGLLAFLAVLLVLSDRPDEVLRDHARVFAVAFAAVVVLVPAALLAARARGAGAAALAAGCAAALLLAVAAGYPLQRHYLESRFANAEPGEGIPGMGLDAAYRWARDLGDADVGLVGTTAGFAGYGFYGTDLGNRVVYLGERGPHAAFNAIPTCRAFRAAVNDAGLDYLVTAPFLNFIHVDEPIASPEERWLRGDPAAVPILRGPRATVWRLRGELDPTACGPAEAPLREVPQTPPG